MFPTDRVLVAGRWRAAYQFGLVDVAGEDPSELALGARQPAQPVVMRRIGGSAQADLLETDWATLLLVSDRLVALLRAASATGWCLFPVDLRAQGDRPVDGYHGLGITGWAGPIKPELGRDVVLPPPVPDGNPVPGTRGWCFEPGTWDGSDVFTPQGAGAFCVTADLAEILRGSGLTGLSLTRMSEIETINF